MSEAWYLREYAVLFYALVAILGLLAGSFLNVVIFRVPRGVSIVRPRSFCPRCRRPIPWYENIPVASYVALRGRCRGCGEPISIVYPLIEALGAALAVLSTWRFGFTAGAAFAYAFLMALAAITVIDWRFRIIPDEISIPFIAAGLLWSAIDPARSLASSALGAAIGGGGLLAVALVYKLVRKVDGLGGGDVKLMAMVGAFLGVKLALLVILLASLAGSVYGVALMRSGKSARTAVAFGSFLAPAAAVCLLGGTPLVTWYVSMFSALGTLHTNLAFLFPAFPGGVFRSCNRLYSFQMRYPVRRPRWHACCVFERNEEIGPFGNGAVGQYKID